MFCSVFFFRLFVFLGMIEVSLLYFTMNLKGDCMAARRPKAIVHRRLNCLILN